LPYLERRIISEAVALKVCSVLTVSCLENHKKEYQPIVSRKIPLLFIERQPNNTSLYSYVFDMEQAAGHITAKVPPDSNVCILTGDSYYSDQAAIRKAFCESLLIGDSDFYENRRGDQSPAVHALLQRKPVPDAIICSNEALADKVQRTYVESGTPLPKIITLSSLRPSHNALYHKHYVELSNVGRQAATAIIGQVENTLMPASRMFPVSGCTDPFSSPRISKKGRCGCWP
jgi:DNA-binding LacI/PurR family transcriptional regulator